MNRIKPILVGSTSRAIRWVWKQKKPLASIFIVLICTFSILAYVSHVSREREREEAEQKVNRFEMFHKESIAEFYSGLELQNLETIQYDVIGYDQIYLSGRIVNKSRYDYSANAGYRGLYGDWDSYGSVKLEDIDLEAPELRLKVLGYDCPTSHIDDKCTIVYDELVDTRISELPRSQARDFQAVELTSANRINPVGQLIFDTQVHAKVDFSYRPFNWTQYLMLPEEFK